MKLNLILKSKHVPNTPIAVGSILETFIHLLTKIQGSWSSLVSDFNLDKKDINRHVVWIKLEIY